MSGPVAVPKPLAFRGTEVELVDLSRDHPGFNDPLYRNRRDAIARLALDYVSGQEIPSIDYNANERGVWAQVWQELQPLHARWACRAYLDGRARFGFDAVEIPSFAEVNARLGALEGFQLAPVAGLVVPATFLQQLAARRFLATQYMRHHSAPLYTPEPDVVHEYIGHLPSLAHPQLAQLNAAFGWAALQARSQARLDALIRVYWYTIEFGLVQEDGALKVFGAGILSSVGELEGFSTRAQLRLWDLEVMSATDFDPTHYQSQLFVAPSFEVLLDDLRGWLDR